MNNRISVDEYYLRIAHAAALRSTCDRAKVGAILVADDIVLGTGYNGSLPGKEHCDRKTCYFNGRCIRTIHAEVNAIERSIRAGWYNKFKNATLYSTHRPCYSCAKTISSFGIKYIVFDKIYDDRRAAAYFELTDMNVIQIELE